MTTPKPTVEVAQTAEEVLGLLGAGLEDVFVKAFGEGKLQFTLLAHGESGLFCISNADRAESRMAMGQIAQQWAQEEQAMMEHDNGCPNDD